MTSGVYEIVNAATEDRYIGSAVDLALRQRQHVRSLRGGRHHNVILQRAWRKYGEEAFRFATLLICAPTREALLGYEQRAIDVLRPRYNLCPTAGSRKGAIVSATTREKIAAAHRGRKRPPEFGAAISARQQGRPRGPKAESTKRKLRDALLGNKNAAGKPKSKDHRAAISRARTGKATGPQRTAHRERNALANGGFVRYEVIAIRRDFAAGMNKSAIARARGVSPSSISRLISGVTYSHI